MMIDVKIGKAGKVDVEDQIIFRVQNNNFKSTFNFDLSIYMSKGKAPAKPPMGSWDALQPPLTPWM